MITIKRIKVNIKTTGEGIDSSRKYGFDFSFKKGLNILSGSNTSGKSTVLSSIYYCLGMEQLLGGNKKDILDQSLTKVFRLGHRELYILESEAILEVENKLGQTKKIRRVIVNSLGPIRDVIYVQENDDEDEKIYFIHSKGDSDTELGFYSWLAKFVSIDLPVYEDEDKRKIKVLYLQQIFAACFIEQTKGWSDFFAQLPFFQTKNPKTKILEFLLGLKDLVGQFRIELLKEREKQEEKKWFNLIEVFNLNVARNQYYVAGLSELYPRVLNAKQINKLNLVQKKEGKGGVPISQIRGKLLSRHEELLRIIDESQSVANKEPVLMKQNQLLNNIQEVNYQHQQLITRRYSENEKIENYKRLIKNYNSQIEQLSGLRKTEGLLQLAAKNFDHCPVCDSKLQISDDFNFSNVERVETDQSIQYYKTEKALLEEYIEKSYVLLESFNSVEEILLEQLSFNSLILQQVKMELVDDNRLPSRTVITEQLSIEFELVKIDNLIQSFENLKIQLVQLSDSIAAIKGEIKSMGEDENDGKSIIAYATRFKSYLNAFKYSSHKLNHVIMSNEPTGKYLPVINYNGDIQSIRLSSSASDFIRSLWAFYLTLIKISRKHPGFLIMDEPGQHAMNFASMRELVLKSSKLKDRQIILAISNDKKMTGEGNEVKYLDDLLYDLKSGEDLTINIIPKGKLSIWEL
ncbi:hypothetical protein [Pseudoflavitalea rhizosphaerae]|uniref:hypothetical protein n=1 Tax=Pseudoflavitalea rhizosphaerae TaxID=1884793 RepID=UPI000F8E42C5|nr:hypothetical protein [Pseudoflavitalea rhizosphaerae]